MKGQMLSRLVIIALFFTALSVPFSDKAYGAKMEKRDSGIKATLKVDAEKSMMDVYLYDLSKALKPIKDAKVTASVILPDGKKVTKELMGMEMEHHARHKVFSFMNSLDMREKGRYIFDIKVKLQNKTAKFNFIYDNK